MPQYWTPDTSRVPLPEQPAKIETPLTPVSATATSGSAGLAIDGYNDSPKGVNNTQHSSKGESLWTSTGALPQSVTVNLGKSYDNIDMLEYLPQRNTGTTAGNITSYKVYVSADNVTFTQVASATWPADPTYHGLMSPERVQFPAQTAQYVRLEAVAVAGGGTSAIIGELAVGSSRGTSGTTSDAGAGGSGGSSGKGDAGRDVVAGADGSAIGGGGGGAVAGAGGVGGAGGRGGAGAGAPSTGGRGGTGGATDGGGFANADAGGGTGGSTGAGGATGGSHAAATPEAGVAAGGASGTADTGTVGSGGSGGAPAETGGSTSAAGGTAGGIGAPDVGSGGPASASGCSCALGGKSSSAPTSARGWLLFGLFALLVKTHQRRRIHR
jgi:MYXO-CTERM domain-containing protein